MLFPLRFPTALARLLTSAQPLHLDAARYAFDETAVHLLNNRTKSVEGSNDRFGLNYLYETSAKLITLLRSQTIYAIYYPEPRVKQGIICRSA
ncbi:hypothetical protein [Prevotella sp. OH937_COT-195]|uniref:hypothetical protein n=1 Tax=Prevotella sp. OH937_COT-195 TaxID=2491051 RepID=UPI000F6452B1|nr:hypothetical protein [Prevotella sp. OH937_COT-195]RRC99497.1 hypothetical protein EII32_07760 [Prevotella sp. OH937_COT-195]